MALRSGLSKLNYTDIGEDEIVLSSEAYWRETVKRLRRRSVRDYFYDGIGKLWRVPRYSPVLETTRLFNDGRRLENVAIVWQCLGEGVGGKGCWNVHEEFTRLKTNCEWTWAVKVYMSRMENIVLHEEYRGLLKRQILAIALLFEGSKRLK